MRSRVGFRLARHGPRRLQQGREFFQGWMLQPVHVSLALLCSTYQNPQTTQSHARPCRFLLYSVPNAVVSHTIEGFQKFLYPVVGGARLSVVHTKTAYEERGFSR